MATKSRHEQAAYDKGFSFGAALRRFLAGCLAFARSNWIGAVVILVATLIFFWPMVTRIDSYSEGGDAMFNAWTLARNHHCIMGQGCDNYSNANIYFPHKDTMLYSETQLSAGLLTLPLFWINDNPIFAYNMWTIISVFLGGFFMYLLAKYLSRGNQFIAVLAGLIFAFAPFKMAAIFHLQNLSIFWLPLAMLLLFKYINEFKKRYLLFLLITLVLLFYASWYNMVFSAAAIAVLIAGVALFKLARWRHVALLTGVLLLAGLATLPLVTEFMRFSKETGANFTIKDQLYYQSSLVDYVWPHTGTIVGNLFYTANPYERQNAFNLDSFSYHGVILYILAAVMVVLAFMHRKRGTDAFRRFGVVASLAAVGFVGFILSLGPLLKLKGSAILAMSASGIGVALPLPYLLLNKLIPPITFIRGVGRWSVLFLLALCCLLAYLAYYLSRYRFFHRYRIVLGVILAAIVIFELAPIHQVPMSDKPYSYDLKVPQVYKYIRERPEINNLVVLRAAEDYPGAPIPIARAEDVLWAGYHNRNIYNGYSGYTPPNYFNEYWDFLDFKADDIAKMRKLDLRYIVVDKQLSFKDPQLANKVNKLVGNKLYEDDRYALHRL